VTKPFVITGKAHEAPAGEDFVWFVYGSALDPEAFAAWAAEHGYPPPALEPAFPARADGWRLAFDVASRAWDGAVASLAPQPGAHVEGLAVPMPGAARGLVEHKEGAVSGLYRPMQIEVTTLRGGTALRAIAYVSEPGRRLPAEAPPSRRWLDVLVRGARARGLSAGWIAELERLRG
jgi:hypothetical protein